MLQKKEEELGRDAMLKLARRIVLQTVDLLWVEHLESMEYLRGSVNLRAYGQRDPLTEYRKEGTLQYKQLEMILTARVFELIESLTPAAAEQAMSLAATPRPAPTLQGSTLKDGEMGRNDPCPCGSGKKWKNCGLNNTEEHQTNVANKK